MSTKLLIEKILPTSKHGQYVLVRLVNTSQQFTIIGKTFLDNVELEPFLDLPRKIKEDGRLDLSLFVVKLKDDHEAFRLKENSIVELIPGDSPCLPPWYFVEKGVTNQLQREISKGHVLFGKDVKTIARRKDNDDVLFAVFGSDFKYAKVHLTWSESTLKDTTSPATTTFKDWEDVYEHLFLPDSRS